MTAADSKSGYGSPVDDFVLSSDGTRIGFTRIGSGPALTLVHGSISAREDWLPVARLLANRFTCYVMDRRGRGLSGDASTYAIERECDDIAAVLAAAGRGANLLGHSFGAICALETAMRTEIPRLILYEPPLPVGGPVAGAALEDYRGAITAGRLDDALEIGLARFVGLPDEQIRRMRATPIWPHLRLLAPTWTRELETIDHLSTNVDRYRALTPSVLLLAGSESAEHPLKDATRALERVLRNVRTMTLAGQGHMASRLVPDLVAQVVSEFLQN